MDGRRGVSPHKPPPMTFGGGATRMIEVTRTALAVFGEYWGGGPQTAKTSP